MTSLAAMDIRPAEWHDLRAIEEIVEAAYAKYVKRIGGRPGPMEVDYGEALARADLFVAVVDGTVVGLSVLASQSDHLLIENVAVSPNHQGRGFGGALLAHAEGWARRLGHRRLRLYTHESMVENIALYEGRGYLEERRGPRHGATLVFMAKQI
jgi:GNAT superfamily N-acetyltransferase